MTYIKFTNPKFKVEEVMAGGQVKSETLLNKLQELMHSPESILHLDKIKTIRFYSTLKLAHLTKQKGHVKSSVTVYTYY